MIDEYHFKSKEDFVAMADLLPYPFAIAETNPESNIVELYFNQNILDEFGYSVDEINSVELWYENLYPNAEYREFVRQYFESEIEISRTKNEKFVKIKAKLTPKNQQEKWYEIKAFFINTFFVLAFVDINNEVLLQEELKKQNENNNRMLSVLGHDLRTPIANLYSISSLAISNNISSIDFVSIAELINKESMQVLNMLETTINWAKLNFNSLQLNASSIDYQNLVENVVAIYQENCSDKQISVLVDLRNFKTKETDEEIVTIIIRNLISNAIKFTPTNGKISIYALNNCLVVEDFGIGMSQEKLQSIRTNSYTSCRGTNNELGIGLGLQLVMKLSEKINSKISFESEVDKGTKAILMF
ncbi:sensor histidine kinase [Flavobacterium terrigena]|uniref:histidine kinase n=1 Tax=Flavobacterium terrigena TaxID=402734 RepID=A0A1H6QPN0_9FLAO|nr:PAS domain-containing sensor histidine kinase [Flavobacterium terrigena]SEI45621.1 Histidine kinase-, DNA gyrase B-, and HSP90-like ATPase [Flavobacterium terrigena]